MASSTRWAPSLLRVQQKKKELFHSFSRANFNKIYAGAKYPSQFPNERVISHEYSLKVEVFALFKKIKNLKFYDFT